eukprot:403331098
MIVYAIFNTLKDHIINWFRVNQAIRDFEKSNQSNSQEKDKDKTDSKELKTSKNEKDDSILDSTNNTTEILEENEIKQ